MNEFAVTVRPMAAPEAPAVASMIRSIIEPLTYYNDRAKAEEVAKYSSERLIDTTREEPLSILVALHDASIVGFCVSKYDDGLLWLSWFGVEPSFRGRGIGNRLLQALASTLPERNAHKIWCDTRTDNELSQRVLRRVGFKQTGTLTNHWYGQDFLLWEWYP